MTNIVKNKACPFCGCSDIDVEEGSTFRWVRVSCTECGASCGEVRKQTFGDSTPEQWQYDAEIQAIEAWNTRAPV